MKNYILNIALWAGLALIPLSAMAVNGAFSLIV